MSTFCKSSKAGTVFVILSSGLYIRKQGVVQFCDLCTYPKKYKIFVFFFAFFYFG